MSTTATLKLFDPLRDLILDRLDQIEHTPSMMEQDTIIGKFLIMAGEYLTEEDIKGLFQLIGLTAKQRHRFVGNYVLSVLYSTNHTVK